MVSKIMINYENKYFVLCIDLERFLVPLEFGNTIGNEEISRISIMGGKNVKNFLKEHRIKATIFVTIDMAEEFPELIKELDQDGHEIALHFDVRSNTQNQVSTDKNKLEKIINKEILGFRTHRFESFPSDILKKQGFLYNNSSHPTFVPGRYFHLFKTTQIQKKDGIWEIPASVTPILRFPFSWVWFRNLGIYYSKFCTWCTYVNHDIVNIYFHNWDLENLTSFNFNWKLKLIFRNSGDKCIEDLNNYIKWLQNKNLKFVTFKEYLFYYQQLRK